MVEPRVTHVDLLGGERGDQTSGCFKGYVLGAWKAASFGQIL